MGTPTLALLNGAPGSGKSTIAAALAAERPLALALDVDALKHALGGWETDQLASGLQARRLALAVAERHLRDGHDVVVGQYLARTDFIEQLDALAREVGARFVEALLAVDAPTLAARLAARAGRPTRPEHGVNARLVGPADAPALVDSLASLPGRRPGTVVIDAGGDEHATLAAVRRAVNGSGNHDT